MPLLYFNLATVFTFRIEKAKSDEVKVIHVDGSQLERITAVLSSVACACSLSSSSTRTSKWLALCVLPASLYSYLAEGVGNMSESGAF